MKLWPLILLLSTCATIGHAADSARSASAADQKAIAEVLDTNERMVAVVLQNRSNDLGQFFAADCLVHGSNNAIIDCAEVVERFRSGQLRFSRYERNVERTLVNGDVVVLMGEEIVVPAGQPAAQPVHRRITSAWRKIDGRWQQFARQSTVVEAR